MRLGYEGEHVVSWEPMRVKSNWGTRAPASPASSSLAIGLRALHSIPVSYGKAIHGDELVLHQPVGCWGNVVPFSTIAIRSVGASRPRG